MPPQPLEELRAPWVRLYLSVGQDTPPQPLEELRASWVRLFLPASWGRPGSVCISPCWSPAWRSEKQKEDVQRPLSESLEASSLDGRPLVHDPLLNWMGVP